MAKLKDASLRLTSPLSTPRSVCVLGATGSVGRITLDYLRILPDQFQVQTLVARGSRLPELAAMIRAHNPRVVAVHDQPTAVALRQLLPVTPNLQILWGIKGIHDAVSQHHDIVVAAISGIDGLAPVMQAIPHTRILAISNKESLVCAGHLIMHAATQHNVALVPVDSEHSSALSLLETCWGPWERPIARLTLTASGGAVRHLSKAERAALSPDKTFLHPVWPEMGRKLMVDSSTMANKILELLEAKTLFALSHEQLHACLHPQGIVHALVTFVDGTTHAVLSSPSMIYPIARSLWWPYMPSPTSTLPNPSRPLSQSHHQPSSQLDSHETSVFGSGKTSVHATLPFPSESIELLDISLDRYPLMNLASEILRADVAYHVAFDAANNTFVQAFLERQIRFDHIASLLRDVLQKSPPSSVQCDSLEGVLELHAQTQRVAQKFVNQNGN